MSEGKQSYRVQFIKNGLSKCPFLKQTTDYIRPLGLQIEDLTSGETTQVLQLEKMSAMRLVHLTRF